MSRIKDAEVGVTPLTQDAPAEDVVWRLRKGDRIAEARVRKVPFGYELRFVADGVLRWSQFFAARDNKLVQLALEKRQDLERLGWQLHG